MARCLLLSGVVWTLALTCVWPVCARERNSARPVIVIAPMSPGGGTDLVGRAFAEALNHQTAAKLNTTDFAGGVGERS